jgi:hypothetical protein
MSHDALEGVHAFRGGHLRVVWLLQDTSRQSCFPRPAISDDHDPAAVPALATQTQSLIQDPMIFFGDNSDFLYESNHD